MIASDDPDYNAALHFAVCGEAPQRGGRRHPAVEDLLSDAASGPSRLELVHGGYHDGHLASAVLVVESPGRAGLVMVPPLREQDGRLYGTGLALRELVAAAWSRSYGLLEILLPQEVTHLLDVLRGAGFRRLTDLIYLHRLVEPGWEVRRRLTGMKGLTWTAYSEHMEPLFCEVVRRSYVQSSDCPELTSIRSPREALASHRAAGIHQPDLWFVAMRGSDPVGVLLLCRMRRQPAVEIVYVGVVQPARGTGVADALMVRALEASQSVGAKTVALAVDARNIAARRFYERWEFKETAVRSAWIATPGGTDTCGSKGCFQH